MLRLNGEIHFKTDNAPLFEWSLGEFEACGLEIRNLTRNLHENGPVGIMTGYEEKFYALGTPINRCELINHGRPARSGARQKKTSRRVYCEIERESCEIAGRKWPCARAAAEREYFCVFR